MKTYRVRVTRDEPGWLIEVDGVKAGFSFARKLADVEGVARDLVATLRDVAPASFGLEVAYPLPEAVVKNLGEAMRLRESAAEMQRDAGDLVRRSMRQLADSGWTMRDIGAVVGLSHQRVDQLLKSGQ